MFNEFRKEGDRPGSDARAAAPRWHLAELIRIESGPNGAPMVSIDGHFIPWLTCGIDVPAPSLKEAPTVTITFLAEKVEMVNEARPPRPGQ